jgi:pyrimidine-nucleoside phosphorylase
MLFNMLDFIESKKKSEEHTQDSIAQFVEELCKKKLPDYQVSAWLMAVRLNGMTDSETSSLTESMAKSGEMIDLSLLSNTADKHSTGGVGDKTTLIALPLAASAGVNIVKFSGRSLDFTGGTLDKIESIPGFKTSLTYKQIMDQAKRIGLVLAGASMYMVPADRILYALRDVTSTVDSIPLIAASVMSKKIAGGAKSIVLDIKYGDGAFMKRFEDAESLAKLMIVIGRSLDRKVCGIISSMEMPLGECVGNSLEIIESIEVLKGNGSADLSELSMEIASRMVSLSRDVSDIDGIKNELRERIKDGSAIEKFRQLVESQGGESIVVDDYRYLPFPKYRLSYNANQDGFITRIATRKIGNLVRQLGGGRLKKGDDIDPSVGVRFLRKTSDVVAKGDRIVDAYYNDEKQREMIIQILDDAIEIGSEKVELPPIIRKIL